MNASIHAPRPNTNLPLEVGARVIDGDAYHDAASVAVVVELPLGEAWDYHIDALEGSPSVADMNPGYDRDSPVVTIAFESALDARFDVWRHAAPEKLWLITENEGIGTYTYPAERLIRVAE